MRRSEIVAWAIMMVASGSIFAAFVVNTYPLGIIVALFAYTVSTIIVFIGLDEENHRNEDR